MKHIYKTYEKAVWYVLVILAVNFALLLTRPIVGDGEYQVNIEKVKN